MTCIVGLVENGTIYIGGDSAGVDETFSICTRADEKVFVNETEDMIVGFSGSFRIGQLLRYAFVAPPQKVGQDDMAYLVTDFIDALRTMQKDKGSMKKENELEEHSASFLFGFNKKLYVVESDFQVAQPLENYVACGCGADIALGAMYATKHLKMKPKVRLELALNAAAEYSAGVRGPFVIKKLSASPAKEEQ